MLSFRCAVCTTARGLRRLHAWVGEHPICSQACQDAKELRPHRNPAIHLENALASINACEPLLRSAMQAAHFAAQLQHRYIHRSSAGVHVAVALGIGFGAASMIEQQEVAALERARGMLTAEVFALEQHLVPFFCNMMALHTIGYPVIADLAPFAQELLVFHGDTANFEAGHVLEQLQQTYAVLQTVHRNLSQTPPG